MVVKLDENVKKLFAAMRSMAGKTTSQDQKAELRAEIYRLIELVPVDSCNSKGESLIVKAIDGGDVDLVRHLAQKCVNNSGLEHPDMTPLLAASKPKYVEIMMNLLDAEVDLDASTPRWKKHHHALCHAICGRDILAVKRLITTRALIDFHYPTWNRQLYLAAVDNNAPMLLFILEHCAGTDKLESDILQRVIDTTMSPQDTTAVMAALLHHGAAVDGPSEEGRTPLHQAVQNWNTPAVEFLLSHGANATQADEDGRTALHSSCAKADAVTALLAHGALINAIDNHGWIPLHYLACGSVINLKVRPGGSRSYGTDDWTDQDVAASIAALLDHGAAIDQLDHSGYSPLHLAVKCDKEAAVKCLLERGANVALVDMKGKTALHLAREGKIATMLLAHGAQIEAVDNHGRTPLHCYADSHNNVKEGAVQALLEAGANVNATDSRGQTPLHWWAGSCRYLTFALQKAGQLLLDHGADISALNNDNQRPSEKIQTARSKAFLVAAADAQRNNHRYKRPRPEDLQPPAAIAAGTDAAGAVEQGAEEEKEDESEDDSEDEEEDD